MQVSQVISAAIILTCGVASSQISARAAATAPAPAPVAVHIAEPRPFASDAATISVDVAFHNTSQQDATIVWEKVRSIRISNTVLLVGVGGWGSDENSWIRLKPGEKTVRPMTLKIGEDIPALDPGAYRLLLDFTINGVKKAYTQHEVRFKVTGEVPARSLATVVKAAADFYRARKIEPGKKHIGTDNWSLTPNMYNGLWLIEFFDDRHDPRQTERVCVHKVTGKAEPPHPIP